MGIEYSFIYDLVVGALLLGFLFVGAKKGLAGVIVGLAAGFIAFFCASFLSTPIADYFYTTIVEEPLESAVNSSMDAAMDEITLVGLADLDYDAIVINGTPISEVSPAYTGTSKAVMDLSSVDLSGTGIQQLDLSAFGFDDVDFSDVNGKTAELTMSEVSKHGLGRVVVAHIIAVEMQDTAVFRQIMYYTDAVGDTLPMLFGDMADSIAGGSEEAITTLILAMGETSVSVKGAVMDNIIAPVFKTAANTIVFLLIFIIVAAVLGFVSSHLSFLNDIPVVGGINVFGGGIAGLLEGVLAVFVVCIVVRLIIQVTGGDVMFVNNTVIEDTKLFNIFYGLEFLDLLN